MKEKLTISMLNLVKLEKMELPIWKDFIVKNLYSPVQILYVQHRALSKLITNAMIYAKSKNMKEDEFEEKEI